MQTAPEKFVKVKCPLCLKTVMGSKQRPYFTGHMCTPKSYPAVTTYRYVTLPKE